MFAGPNGSGKSTIFDDINVNYDVDGYAIDLKFEEDKIINPNGKTHSYEASILTDFIRSQLIGRGEKITFETVMSHRSKVEILRRAHTEKYRNYLYFICTENAEINKFRVEERVRNGGHPVAPKKIEERYYRSLKLLREAVKYTYRTFIFDNSGSKSRFILDIYKGQIVTYHSEIDEYLFNK